MRAVEWNVMNDGLGSVGWVSVQKELKDAEYALAHHLHGI